MSFAVEAPAAAASAASVILQQTPAAAAAALPEGATSLRRMCAGRGRCWTEKARESGSQGLCIRKGCSCLWAEEKNARLQQVGAVELKYYIILSCLLV